VSCIHEVEGCKLKVEGRLGDEPDPSPQRQSARMPKITNDGLARTGTGMLYSCTLMATVGVMVKIQQNANFVLYSLFGDDTSPLPASGDASTLVIFLNSWFRTL